MLLELLLLLVTTICLADYLYRRRQNGFFEKAGIRGPRTIPILGNGHNLIRESPKTVFDLQQRLINDFGKNIRIWVLHESGFMTADARMMEAILSSQQVITKDSLYDMLQSWLGTGLLLSTGKKWHTRRKIITPTFHFKILEQFVEVFDQQSAVMAEQLYDRADGKTVVNLFPATCLAALDIIAETAMGVKINAQRQPNFPYVQSVNIVSSITAERFMNPIQRLDGWMRVFFPRVYRKLHENIKSMHDFTDGVIEERREALQKSIADGTHQASQSNDDADVGSKRRMALLDVLLQSTVGGEPLSNEDIREEVDTFMFEGHDTTTSGISFTLYLIARHPQVQAQLFQEIREVIGDDKSRPVGMRELNELKYLECVIKESLRLYPPVPMIGRRVTQDVTLDGKLIPANTNIILLTYHALRDPDYFPEPEKFIPERFSAERKGEINPFAYTPFSAGPRNCIGQKFAMLEMKSTVSKILRHFELLPLGEEVQPQMNLILRSSTGINAGLKKRVY
ncbi:probable cytochrome P450 4d14 [Scaptodrosophila lebanonensis]|uniref:Probable cytochrome P450 4d14 n=1 Tax=Drosophila lebanonensis TaxID=7225 RepID=A0A6J2TS79_DROLE|nr:probable cytochrome P450 4d14 [Scaptodrosophila lebanonensis]